MIGSKYLLFLSSCLLAGSLAAMDQPQPKPQQSQAQAGSARKMRGACRQEASAVFTSVDKALADVKKAKTAEDPAALKTALSDAEVALQKVHDHMSSCSPAARGAGMRHGMGWRQRRMRDGMGGADKPTPTSAQQNAAQ
jgi:hypothetical protein